MMINLKGHLFLLLWRMIRCRPANDVFSEGRQIGFPHRTPDSTSCGLAARFVVILRATQRGTGPAQQKSSSIVAIVVRLKVSM